MRKLIVLLLILACTLARAQTTTNIYDTVGNSFTRTKVVTKLLSEMPDSVWVRFGGVSVKVPKASFLIGGSVAWEGVTNKPSTFTPASHSHDYTSNEITNKPTIPTNTNQLTNGAGYLVAGDISGKQNTLVSGTTIKTINGSTVLGSGDLVVSGAAAWGNVTGTISNQTDLNNALAGKSATGHTHLKADVTGYQGYSINVQALTSSPTDAQTVYFGMLPKAPTTSANISKVYIRKAGTLKIAEIYCYS